MSWPNPSKQSSITKPEVKQNIIKTRVSAVASIESYPCCTYVSMVTGIKEPVGISAYIGSALHDVRYWFNKNVDEISKSLEAEDVYSIWDHLKRSYTKAGGEAINKQKARMKYDNVEFEPADMVHFESVIYEDVLRQAANTSMNLRMNRKYYESYQHPKLLLLEGNDSKTLLAKKVIDGVTVEVTAHQDVAIWIPISSVWCAYDYKTGRPTPIDQWIEPYHLQQLNGYSWIIVTLGLGKCPIGVVIFTQESDMFSHRYVPLNPDNFEKLLRILVGWSKGERPDWTPCTRAKYCSEEKRLACKQIFGW